MDGIQYNLDIKDTRGPNLVDGIQYNLDIKDTACTKIQIIIIRYHYPNIIFKSTCVHKYISISNSGYCTLVYPTWWLPIKADHMYMHT